MTGPWTIRLDTVTPSLNQVRNQHWSSRALDKKILGWMLVGALNRINRIPLADGKRRLTIVRHGKKALDKDNLFGGMKDLVDCIKARKLILDDNPNDCELICQQVVDSRMVPHTVIMIEDLTPERVESH